MTKNRIIRFYSVLSIILIITNCTPKHKRLELERIKIQEEMLNTADQAYQKGSYFYLIKAEEIYNTLADEYSGFPQIHQKHLKTLLLLALRSKELGIPSAAFEEKAQDLMRSNPPPLGYGDLFQHRPSNSITSSRSEPFSK